MIDDLDKSIRALLQSKLRISNVKITFDTPDAQFRPRVEPPTVNLFLYDVRENRDLRSNEPTRGQRGNRVTLDAAPLRVDCSYLVTAWTGDGSSTRNEDEHQLLSQAMLVLAAHPRLPLGVLQGALRPPEHLLEDALAVDKFRLPTAALQPGRLQSIGEFWQALGGNPKAAFDYTVTIDMALGKSSDWPPVKEVTLQVARPDGVEDHVVEEIRYRSGPANAQAQANENAQAQASDKNT